MHSEIKLSPKAMAILQPLVEIELYQSSVYMQGANLCNKLGFLSAEKYFLKESEEEREHAKTHYDFIVGMGSEFTMPAIDAPEFSGKDLYEITEVALKMEAEVTDMYRKAASSAMEVDPVVFNHLLQYLKIQQDAVTFYVDACAVLANTDRNTQLILDKVIYG